MTAFGIIVSTLCFTAMLLIHRGKRRLMEVLILELLDDQTWTYGLDLIERSDNTLPRGTIYVYLRSMEERGLIESSDHGELMPGRKMKRRLFRKVAASVEKSGTV